ncbi:MAG: hypothetical protein SGJ20_21205 [Planctomycetota bacterium]|nr:hypothetical protein [Planctomycetota bacterium]
MNNPWLNLPESSPFVLDCDMENVEKFNSRLPLDSPTRLHIDNVISEPFVGAVSTASLIILQLNPGSDDTNVASHGDPAFRKALLGNLRHAATEWPFYFLDPRFRQTHPGGLWWSKKLNKLLDVVGFERLSRKLAVIEWFPYKSPRFKHGCQVPSQEYGFWLVRSAIERGALIIVSRAILKWEESVPELRSYAKKLTLSSTQNVAVTPNNLKYNSAKCPEAWQMVLGAFDQ